MNCHYLFYQIADPSNLQQSPAHNHSEEELAISHAPTQTRNLTTVSTSLKKFLPMHNRSVESTADVDNEMHHITPGATSTTASIASTPQSIIEWRVPANKKRSYGDETPEPRYHTRRRTAVRSPFYIMADDGIETWTATA